MICCWFLARVWMTALPAIPLALRRILKSCILKLIRRNWIAYASANFR